MNALALMATLGLDTSQYESGLRNATGSAQNFASKLKTLLGGIAAGKLLFDIGKGAVNAFKDYEQLVGGIDTLFKSSSSRVQAYANQAYKTAGMSANEYMSTAIGFSASLLNSLNGDTKKAAEQTDKAITDMADNANKMGTSLEMIQNAYRGFARGNFTMLDNLSLGFSGTREGMQELLDKAQAISGVKYDISSLSDIIDAIHEVQTAMDITGTTAKEAADTIEGSANAVKASWQNVLAAIAGGGDLGSAVDGLIDSLFGKGGGGLVNNLAKRIPDLVKGIVSFIGKAVPRIAKELPGLLAGLGKSIITSLPSMLAGLAQAIPETLVGLFEGINNALNDDLGATIDRVSERFQNIKRLVEAGIKGTVSLDADDGSAVLEKASSLVEELKSDTYKGKIVIDGDPTKAQEAIAALDAAIQGLTDGTGSVAELQAAIAECENLTISPDLPESEVATVKQRLEEIKGQLSELKSVSVSVTFGYHESADSNETGWSAFKSFVDARGWESKDFTYSATGKFTVEGSTTEQIEAFANAVTHAATAIGEYDEAAKGITTVAEQKLKADMANVEMQATEELKELAVLYNKGALTEEQYAEYGENILKKTEAQIKELTDNYQQTVENAEKFADGLKNNDYETALKMNAELYGGEEISEETYRSALANLKEMGESGRTSTENDQISAKVALDYLTSKASETKEMVDQANDDYKSAMAEVEKMQGESDETQGLADMASNLSSMVEWLSGTDYDLLENRTSDTEEAMSRIMDAISAYENNIAGEDVFDDSKIADLLSSLLYDEEGNAREMDNSELLAAISDVIAELNQSAQDQQEAADQAKQDAQNTLQEALKSAAENNELSSEATTELIELIRQAGVEVSEETAGLITNVEQAAETAANQAVGESESAIQRSLDTIKSLNEAVASLEQQENAAISGGGASGAASMGGSIVSEGASAAQSVEAKLDAAISKARTLNLSVGPLKIASVGHASAMAHGEILRGLTPFGVDGNGTVHYGGEAGAEAVVGVNSLDRMIQKAVSNAMAGVLGKMDELRAGQGRDMQLVLDSGELVGGIANQMNRRLGSISRWREGGHA